MRELRWTTLESKQLLKDKWTDVRADTCQTAEGKIVAPFYVYGFPDYATAVAITKDGKVILERMYRHGLGVISTELPGGCVDATDASLEDAMARELLEETGYRFEKIEYLGAISPNPTTNTNLMRMFLATGGEYDPSAARDTEEDVEVFLVAWDEFIDLFKKQGFIQSMQTCTILYALMHMGKLNIQ